MAMKSLGFAGIVIAVLTVACGGDMPLSPSQLNNERAAAETPTSTKSPTSPPTLTTQYISDATVTLQPDGTASPAVVSVGVDHTILMVNKSSKYVRVRSSNCGEFATMGLQPGGSSHTMPFRPAGKTCEYHVSAYPNIIYQGQVNVD